MKRLKRGKRANEADYCYTCPCFSYHKDDREFSGVAECKKYQDQITYRQPYELGRLVCDEA